MAVSRTSSVRSLSSKSSSYLSQSTPPSIAPSSSGRSNTTSRSLRIKAPQSHPLSKSLSAASFASRGSMSPTSSSSTSLPFPPTPRDDDELSTGGLSSIGHQDTSSVSDGRSQTPTAKVLKPKRSIPRLRPRSVSTSRSAPASSRRSSGDDAPPVPGLRPVQTTKLPGASLPSPSSPRPLRLPALQLQRSMKEEKEAKKLRVSQPGVQPGQSAKRGTLLGYNRDLHDRQKAAATGKPAPVQRRAYGSLPTTTHSSLQAPGHYVSRLSPPSPSRTLAPLASGQPRIGTGMVYRGSSGNSSLPKRQPTISTSSAPGRRSEPF
jgi:hypothetical protein